MIGCHTPEFEKCSDKNCIACYGGVWSSIHPPTCNSKIRNSMVNENSTNGFRLNLLEEHFTRQIDENRKISRRVDDEINSLQGQIEGLHQHIEKLHDMVNLEDRITACDVLNRITKLENQVDAINKQKFSEFHHLKPDIENLNKRLDKLEEMQSAMLSMPNIVWQKYHKTPHKCPVCDGKRVENNPRPGTGGLQFDPCLICEGKGIVWG